MKEVWIDYNKTVDVKRIVFKGYETQKIFKYFFVILIIVMGVGISIALFKSQMIDIPERKDYIVGLIFPIFILLLVVIGCNILLNRDKLEEIGFKMNPKMARSILLQGTKNLNWEPCEITDNYMVFRTKFRLSDFKDCQTISLIFFPDNRIYFNSVNHPVDFIRPASFMDNYNSLMNECLKIEKE